MRGEVSNLTGPTVKTLVSVAVVLVTTLLLSSAPPTSDPAGLLSQNKLLEKELDALTQRGLTYRIVDTSDCPTCSKGKWVEVYDPRTALTNRFPLGSLLMPCVPTYLGLPTLTVDLRTIDTSLYNWRFHYESTMPITGTWGFPVQVADFRSNGKPEAYGLQQTQSNFSTRIYEMNLTDQWELRHIYPGNVGRIDNSGDVDANGLAEVYGRYGDSLFAFEQAAVDSLPTLNKFRHMQWYGNATGIPNQIDFMTGGRLPEIVYRGAEALTSEERIYVVRYDSVLNDLRRIWSVQIPPACFSEGCPWSLVTGDFDGDGNREVATSTVAGQVYIMEHTLGDSFAVTWSSNLSVAGRAASGDVDGNGITEVFIGGTQAESDGYVHLRAYAYERTQDNTYQPVFEFNVFPAGIFFVDLYQTTDVDGDGAPELLLSFAGGIAVIKGVGEHNYQLFYYRPVSSLDGVAAWPIDNSGAAHLFVSRSIGSQQIISQTDVYSLDSTLIVAVAEEDSYPSRAQLFQNYPNPFNPTTTLSFDLPEPSIVSLLVYDLLGRRIAEIAEGSYGAGTHTAVWNAADQASGVYLARFIVMSASGGVKYSKVNKLVLMK